MLVALAGCLDDDVGPTPPGDDEFVAFQEDFLGYEDWDGWLVAVDPEGDTHLDGPRWVYANALPPSGSASFPVGTILVKEARNGDRADWDVFAMVKRGGSFNTAGAHGWEWFELQLVGDEPVIAWRGDTPPSLAGYECAATDPSRPTGDCNACHGAAWANDYVQDDVLRLGDLP